MSDCDMVAVFESGGNKMILDLWSTNHDTPRDDSSLGGKQDYTVSLTQIKSWTNQNGNLTAVLVRKMDTGDKYDYALTRDESMSICWGYLDRPQFAEHSSFGDGKITWGSSPQNVAYLDTTGSDGLQGHQGIMTIMWLLLINIAVIFARYFKAFSRWYLIHFILGSVVIILSYISISIVYKKDKATTFDQDTLYHSRLGMIMMATLFGEGILGLITRMFMMFTFNVNVIIMARRMHRVLGYSLVAIGFAACWFGSKIDGEDTPAGEIVAYIIWFAIYAIFEILWRLGHRRIPCLKGLCKKRKEMTHAEVLEQVVTNKKPWAFYDKYVLDMTHFTNPHPGGAFLIRETYGEDYGKYLSGTNGYGSYTSGYAHSTQAYMYMKWLIIGKLAPQANYFVGESPGYKWMRWDLDQSVEVAPSTNILSFKHESLKIVERFSGIDWIGKHFGVRAFINGKWIVRYYSLSAAISRLAENLTPGSLNMLIKTYPPHGKMSTHVFKLQKGDPYEFKGPLGPGLALSPQLDGQCLAIGGGTGLVPFLDLIEMMMFAKTKFLSGNYPLELLNTNLSLVVYAGFRSVKDNFAKQLLDKAANAFKDEQSPKLKIIVAYDEDKSAEKLSVDLLQKTLMAEKVTRAWVCGPPGFNKFALDTMVKAGLDRRAIMVM